MCRPKGEKGEGRCPATPTQGHSPHSLAELLVALSLLEYQKRGRCAWWDVQGTSGRTLHDVKYRFKLGPPYSEMCFHLAYSFLCCEKAFKLSQVPLVYFVIISITLGGGS